MSETVPTSPDGCLAPAALSLAVGCTFGLESVQPAVAIMQVAPYLEAGMSVVSERWETAADHHAYVDHYGNRCERFEIPAGVGRIDYEARLLLSEPDKTITFVMPSRFCCPTSSVTRPGSASAA